MLKWYLLIRLWPNLFFEQSRFAILLPLPQPPFDGRGGIGFYLWWFRRVRSDAVRRFFKCPYGHTTNREKYTAECYFYGNRS